jgi:predicted AAA+ superfamily ATPase
MPGLVHEETAEEKIALLKNILQTYLLKDIKSLIKEENIRAYNNLLYNLAQSQGSPVSVSSLAREIGLSEPAVKYHLELMAQTYVCFPLESYSGNLANELKKVKKYYLYDIGIRNSILRDFSNVERRQDKGIILETFVFLSIIKQLKPNMEVRFWRTRQGDEIDFILLKNRIPVPLEVKYQWSMNSVPDGLRKFLQKYKNAPYGIVITKGGKGEIECEDRPVKFLDWHKAEDLDYLQSVES